MAFGRALDGEEAVCWLGTMLPMVGQGDLQNIVSLPCLPVGDGGVDYHPGWGWGHDDIPIKLTAEAVEASDVGPATGAQHRLRGRTGQLPGHHDGCGPSQLERNLVGPSLHPAEKDRSGHAGRLGPQAKGCLHVLAILEGLHGSERGQTQRVADDTAVSGRIGVAVLEEPRYIQWGDVYPTSGEWRARIAWMSAPGGSVP